MNRKELYAIIGEMYVEKQQYTSLIKILQDKQQTQSAEIVKLQETIGHLNKAKELVADRNND